MVVKWIDLGYAKYIQCDGELVDGNQVLKVEIKRTLNYVCVPPRVQLSSL